MVLGHYHSKMNKYTPCEDESCSVGQEMPHHFYNVKDCLYVPIQSQVDPACTRLLSFLLLESLPYSKVNHINI